MVNPVIRIIDRALMGLAAIGLLAMMLHISLDVLSGLFFNAPIAVTSAYVTQYYMIAVAFLPLAAAEYRGVHIGVDLVVNKLPASPRRGMHLVVLLVTLGVYLLLAAQSWEQATKKFGIDAFIMEQTTRVSVWPSFFILPVSFALVSLLIAVKFVLCLAGRPEPAAAEEAELSGAAERPGNV
jgi:TRAP-type C4-dicarboxylate transport system permease small subunit